MKLLADAMLGRLAKWLRILGYDTVYLPDTDDYAVMRLARAEDRLILTRDTGLVERRGVRALLIFSDGLEDQLREVHAAVGHPGKTSSSRCSTCNQPLIAATPALVAARVPPYVRKAHECFTFCTGCDRIYWQGSHWKRMQSVLAELRIEAGFDKMTFDTCTQHPPQ